VGLLVVFEKGVSFFFFSSTDLHDIINTSFRGIVVRKKKKGKGKEVGPFLFNCG
jgi:hypothetical protein